MREQHLGANPSAIYGQPEHLLSALLQDELDGELGADAKETLSQLPPFTTYSTQPPVATFTSSRSYISPKHTREQHDLSIAFDHIDWDGVRAYQGWAALQYQAYLGAELQVECGPKSSDEGRAGCLIAITVARGAEFAFVPRGGSHRRDGTEQETRWYTGDLYSYNDPPSPFSSAGPEMNATHQHAPPPPRYPHIVSLRSGTYILVLRAIYEDRIFGDPRDSSAGAPISPTVNLAIDIAHLDAGQDAISGEAAVGRKKEEQRLSVRNVLVPDVVNGHLAGWGIAIDVLNHARRAITINKVELKPSLPSRSMIRASMDGVVKLSPLQTRPVQVRMELSLHGEDEETTANGKHTIELEAILHGYDDEGLLYKVSKTLSLQLVNLKSTVAGKVSGQFVFTYLTGDGSVAISAARAPKALLSAHTLDADTPALLALHGAGANALDPIWAKSIPRQETMWTVLPTGGTPWGFDWQLTTHIQARCAVDALSKGASTLLGLSTPSPFLWDARVPLLPGARRLFDPHRLFLLGHSNGGQGVWHYLTKRPNEVLGAIIGASYIKLASYVPLDWSLGSQHADPLLGGVLRSALGAFENDLGATNAVGVPLLVKYGAEDSNVPGWHSRSMASLVMAHNMNCLGNASEAARLIRLAEVPRQNHWWDTFFLEDEVVNFLREHGPGGNTTRAPARNAFPRLELVVVDPRETGAMGMWRVTRVLRPGRIARLIIRQPIDGFYLLDGVNVGTIALDAAQVLSSEAQELQIDGQMFDLRGLAQRALEKDGRREIVLDLVRHSRAHDMQSGSGSSTKMVWTSGIDMDPDKWSRPIGPLLRALTSSGPLQIVLPSQGADGPSAARREHYESIARRWAHDVWLYGRIDARIVLDREVVSVDGARSASGVDLKLELELVPGALSSATVVVLGGPEDNLLAAYVDRAGSGPREFRIEGDLVRAKDGRPLTSPCLAYTTLGPHPLPSASNDSLALQLWGNSACGLEAAARLLPVRTGAQVPEFVLVDGERAAWSGAGGVLGAGWYDAEWGWSERASFLS